MRRRNIISRFAALVLATLACLLLAVLAPMLTVQRATDEPFSGYAVMASPRDMHVITAPIRLSSAPDLTLNRGTLYADGNAASGTPISQFVLDGPVFYLNASGGRGRAAGFDGSLAPNIDAIAPLLIDQLLAMGFEVLTLRRGTLNVTAADGSWETLSDIEAELSGRRKGQIAARGSFMIRGQRVSFDAAFGLGEKRARWPLKLTLKGDLLEASLEGQLHAEAGLELAGQAELSTPSLRRGARWFGAPVANAEGLNAASIKGQINWARNAIAFGDARITLDGNEATGALVANFAGERPLIDGTLAFRTLDLTPYVEAARSRSFLFDRQTATWSAFDLSFPLIRYFDADLRISTPKVVVKGQGLGAGAATITVRAGKLLADIADLELHSGKVSAQVTASINEIVPRYTVRGKVENFDAGPAAASLLGSAVLSGRSTLSVDLAGSGQTPAELLRTLSGKASLSVVEGGRVALDVKALRAAAARADGAAGWGALAKGQTGLDQIEARALIRDGVLITDAVQARAGTLGLAASGRVDLSERTLDLHLSVKPNVPTDRPLKPADMVDAEAITLRGFWQEPFVRAQEPPGADAPR
jgi:uncharacterized protein involved in outer membrane biogenesis